MSEVPQNILELIQPRLSSDFSLVDLEFKLPDGTEIGVQLVRRDLQNGDVFDPFNLSVEKVYVYGERWYSDGDADEISAAGLSVILLEYELTLPEIYVYAMENPDGCVDDE